MIRWAGTHLVRLTEDEALAAALTSANDGAHAACAVIFLSFRKWRVLRQIMARETQLDPRGRLGGNRSFIHAATPIIRARACPTLEHEGDYRKSGRPGSRIRLPHCAEAAEADELDLPVVL